MKHFLLTILVGLGIVLPCQAGLFCRPCSRCGCCQVKKVCRMVPDVKKVPEYTYTVACEEICMLGKSCTEDVAVPDACCPNGMRCETVTSPRCGRPVCVKKLKKTTTIVEKPIVRCVVDTVCCQCGCVCDTGSCVPQ